MNAEELVKRVRQRPFEPFRMHVSDGRSFEVRHPEQIIVSRRSSYVGLGGNGDIPFQKVALVSNIHITSLDPLDGEDKR